MANTNLNITTIKPTMGAYVSFQPRSKEGEEKRLAVFASYSLPADLAIIANSTVKDFARRAYESELIVALRNAVKEGKSDFPSLAISECFAETKREFLVTKEAITEWFDSFVSPILTLAIASKSGLSPDSVKVVKKVLEYKALLIQVSARSIMNQTELDLAMKVMGLILESESVHSYSDNVLEGIARKQENLTAWLASKPEEDSIDF